MKKLQKGFAIPIIISVVALLAIGGIYYWYQSSNNLYEQTLSSEVNFADRHFENIVSELAQNYLKDNKYFSLNIGTFSSKDVASIEISRLSDVYNPGMINLNGKYVKYIDQGNNSNLYFYQSGNLILMIRSTSDKAEADKFVSWLYKQYSPL
jgi:broad specificity polyphosphatase/5'/3'-nucleotidase SurE